jgi:hypothetical protein
MQSREMENRYIFECGNRNARRSDEYSAPSRLHDALQQRDGKRKSSSAVDWKYGELYDGEGDGGRHLDSFIDGENTCKNEGGRSNRNGTSSLRGYANGRAYEKSFTEDDNYKKAKKMSGLDGLRNPKDENNPILFYQLKNKIIHKAMIKYLNRVKEYRNVHYLSLINIFTSYIPCTLLSAYVYLKRYLDKVEFVREDCVVFIRIFLVCCIISSKYSDDHSSSNSDVCEIWNFPLKQINIAENHVLSTIDYDLKIEEKEFREIIESEQFFGNGYGFDSICSKYSG